MASRAAHARGMLYMTHGVVQKCTLFSYEELCFGFITSLAD